MCAFITIDIVYIVKIKFVLKVNFWIEKICSINLFYLGNLGFRNLTVMPYNLKAKNI